MQTLDRRHSLALKDDVVAHRFHAKNCNTPIGQHREYFLFETVEMCVHHIQRHLNGVELESMIRSCGQHRQMYIWTFVSGKADKADLTCLLGFQYGLHPTTFGKNPIRIGVAMSEWVW